MFCPHLSRLPILAAVEFSSAAPAGRMTLPPPDSDRVPERESGRAVPSIELQERSEHDMRESSYFFQILWAKGTMNSENTTMTTYMTMIIQNAPAKLPVMSNIWA